MAQPSTYPSDVKWLHITNIEELKHYESYWLELEKYAPEPLFSSFTWLNHWKEVFWNKSHCLHLYLAFENEKCVLIAPFYIETLSTFPFIKKLSFLGQGEPEVCEISSEYPDILIRPNFEQLLPVLASKIIALNFDIVHVKSILPNAHLLTVFSLINKKSITETGKRYTYSSEQSSQPILSKNNKSKLNKCNNKLAALNAKCIWVNEDEYQNYWDLMSHYHQKRWTKLNKDGAFSHKKFKQFHYQYRKSHPQHIRMSAVVINKVAIAIHYYFIFNNTLYFYQSGWDEENYANVSPGFALHIWSMKNNQQKNYDFMMGNANNSYKAKLGCNRNNKMYNILLVRSKIKIIFKKLINKLMLK